MHCRKKVITFLLIFVCSFQASGNELAWKRIAAELIDWSICFGVGYGVTSMLVLGTGEKWLLERPEHFLLVNEVGVTLPSLVYFTVGDTTGGTVGKRLLGITLQNSDGSDLSLSRALLRSWVELSPMELSHIGHSFTFTKSPNGTVALAAYSIGLAGLSLKSLAPFFSTGEQGFSDWLADTRIKSTPK